MISIDDAREAEVFHESRDGGPCKVWHRDSMPGVVHPAGQGSWIVFIISDDDDGDWWHITPAVANRFHLPSACPHARSDRPPVLQYGPDLAAGCPRDQHGYDAFGYDEAGYDRNGYDEAGYDRDFYDADGYDAAGYDRNGYNEDGYDRGGYDRNGYDEAGYDRHGYDRGGYDAEGYDAEGFNDDGYNRRGQHCDWPECNRCDTLTEDDELYEMLNGDDVCYRCRDRYYSWCEQCDGYYDDNDADEHQHDDEGAEYEGCCESPQLAFTVRNDGCEPLANDKRIVITLPAGTISAEGLTAIRRYLSNQGGILYDVAYSIDELGDQWQTRAGNFTKRLSRLAYTAYQAKLAQDVLSAVGTIARDHSNAVSVEIEVSRRLNEGADYWYHDGSCWWGSYGESRCAFKTSGGFGIRSFDEHGHLSGRVWVMPLRKDRHRGLTPTFETMAPDAFVVFNGYGDLNGYAAPRIVAAMAGWTYRKIGFSCSPMYVNAGGYLVAPEALAEQFTDGSLHLSVEQHSGLFETEHEMRLANV